MTAGTSVTMPLRRVARRARAWARSAPLVLLYHRVAALADDPWGLAVHPARFDEQMAVLARRGDVVPLAALAEDVAAARRRRAIAVTFDDGYADFHTAALPVLARHRVPVTLFATSGTLDGTREFWWDDLERCLLAPPSLPDTLSLVLSGTPRRWTPPQGRAGRLALYSELHGIVGRLAAAERETVLAALRTWAGVPASPRASHRPLVAAEMRATARSPLVEVGAHTVSHPFLSALPPAEQQREIAESKARLESLTGARVARFSFPHGDRDAATDALVRAAGFAGACGSACAVAGPGTDPFHLPRVEVRDWSGAAFARWLGEWIR